MLDRPFSVQITALGMALGAFFDCCIYVQVLYDVRLDSPLMRRSIQLRPRNPTKRHPVSRGAWEFYSFKPFALYDLR